jgi:hypothetical protein
MSTRAPASRIGVASALLLASLVAVTWPHAAAAAGNGATYEVTDLGGA